MKNKHVIIFGTLILVLAVAYAYRQIKIYDYGIRVFNYKDYLVCDYIPAQKKRTGQWPTGLEGLSAQVSKQLRDGSAGHGEEQLNLVLEFHRQNYRSLEIVSSSEEKCIYILHLKQGNERLDTDNCG